MMKRIQSSTAFEKDVERLVKRNKDMEKLKSAGLDKVLAEMQKQVDEWLKTKK